VRLYARNGYNFADRFLRIVEAIKSLPVQSCFIDGEAIVVASGASPPSTCCVPGATSASHSITLSASKYQPDSYFKIAPETTSHSCIFVQFN
jgi:hypothetical protein